MDQIAGMDQIDGMDQVDMVGKQEEKRLQPRHHLTDAKTEFMVFTVSIFNMFEFIFIALLKQTLLFTYRS